MIKRFLGIIMCASIVMHITLPSIAASEAIAARNAQYDIIETYLDLCDNLGGDHDAAMTQLMSLYPSLEVVDSSVQYYDETGSKVLPTRSSMSDISFVGDSLVYDNDWGTFVYFGNWEWNNFPIFETLAPDDVVGFYTQDPDEMYPLDYFVSGYNSTGTRTAYYNSDEGTTSGPIAKGEDTVWGAAFWIDEFYVRRGSVVVPIRYVSGSEKKVMMKYGHSWSTTEITGIGGEISIDGGGFNISWENNVNHWSSCATSPGVRLPS